MVKEAVLTEPKTTFNLSEIRQQITGVKPAVVSNYLSIYVKMGVLERIKGTRRGMYRFTEEGRAVLEGKVPKKVVPKQEQIDSIKIGNAIIDKIDSLRREIVQLKHQITDSAVRQDADLKAFREQIRGKDATILELRKEVDRQKQANHIKRRTVPMSEVAVIRR